MLNLDPPQHLQACALRSILGAFTVMDPNGDQPQTIKKSRPISVSFVAVCPYVFCNTADPYFTLFPLSTMSINFTLEPSDMRAFIAFNRKYSPANKRLRYAMLLILGILSFQHAM